MERLRLLCVGLLLLTWGLVPLQAEVVSATDPEMKRYLGKEITVEGKASLVKMERGSAMIKFLGTEFVVFIDREVVKEFEGISLVEACGGKLIRATGKVTQYEDLLELTITETSQLLVDGKPLVASKDDEDEDGLEEVSIAVPLMAATVPLTQRQTVVHALLVRDLGSGEEAGESQRLIATATEHVGVDEMKVVFNQPVGKSMRVAMEEAIKYLQIQHKAWPRGFDISIGFQEKFSAKSGPSAAVACALLLDGMITGKVYDPTFAVTGDMNADGSVEPIGGLAAKIRGAGKGGCKLIAIPIRNVSAVEDMVVLNETKWLWEIQIVTIAKFDEAVQLAVAEREANLAQALADFEKLAKELRTRGPAILAFPQVQQFLQKILTACPNHLSARLLQQVGQKKAPDRLSLIGSFNAIDRACKPFIQVMETDHAITSPIARDKYADSLFTLRNLRLKLDQRTIPYADALANFIDTWRSYTQYPISGASRTAEVNRIIRQKGGEASRRYKELRQDPQIMEEIGL